MRAHNYHTIVIWQRAIDTYNLHECLKAAAQKFHAVTDYSILTPRMRELGYSNVLPETFRSKLAGDLSKHISQKSFPRSTSLAH
jgi:hypothetical protein